MKKESGAIPIPRNVVDVTVLLSILFAGCAQPIRELWPPAPGAGSRVILVSIDRWHSMIALHHEQQGSSDRSRPWEEWGYAEQGYYLEGDSGCSGTMRALFIPSNAVVQIARTAVPWSERTPQPPARSWQFHLSESGYRRLVAFLEGSRESPEVISRAFGCSWYRASDSYHAFHHCYHWTARALRSAGLPVWSFYSLFKGCLEAQLDRALEFQDAALDDEPLPASREDGAGKGAECRS